jgi:hypothetical protein
MNMEEQPIVGIIVDGMTFCPSCGENEDTLSHLDSENKEYIYLHDKTYKFALTKCEACGEQIIIHPMLL